MITFHTIIIVY